MIQLPAQRLLLALSCAVCGAACAPNVHAVRPEREPRSDLHAARSAPFVPPFAYEAYVRGELLLAQGDPEAAALQFELATAAPEEDGYLLARLAEAQHRAGDATLAEQTLREAERIAPCEPAVWETRGRWLGESRDTHAAFTAYAHAHGCTDQALPQDAQTRLLHAAPDERAQALWILIMAMHKTAQEVRSQDWSHLVSLLDASETRFLLESAFAVGLADRALLSAIAQRALDKHEPSLLLALMSLHPSTLSPAQQAQLYALTDSHTRLRGLIALYPESVLGGPAASAQCAFLAGDYELTELYATLALRHQEAPTLRALRAEAHALRGELTAAVHDALAIDTTATRRSLVRTLLEDAGLTALAHEVASVWSKRESSQ